MHWSIVSAHRATGFTAMQVLEELADAQAAAASSMSELAELRRQNKELQKQVHHGDPWIGSTPDITYGNQRNHRHVSAVLMQAA
jgi:DNA-binding GntR family transcriptional regulator